MRFSVTVILVVILFVSTIAEAKSRRKARQNKTPKCKYGGKKYKIGTDIKEFDKYCTKLVCAKKGKKAKLQFELLDDCTCNLPPFARGKRDPPKSVECQFNKVKGFKGDIMGSNEDSCLNLTCNASKKKQKFKEATIADCVCDVDVFDYHWGYEGDEDAESWKSYYLACGGSAQSPIDLITSIAEKLSFEAFLELIGKPVPTTTPVTTTTTTAPVTEAPATPFSLSAQYNFVPESATLLNNGHTAQVTIEPKNGDMPTVSGGGLPGDFEFVQYHFHWGSDSTVGSEHLIDGDAFPMEVHFVHYNKAYGDVGTALGKSDGLAVLGFMFEVADEDNSAIDDLISQFADVEEAGADVVLDKPRSLKALMADDLSEFFRYNGSLTTPTCNESVVWTVFKDTIPISETQLEAFRTILKDEKGELIVDNFRPVQPLNERPLHLIKF